MAEARRAARRLDRMSADKEKPLLAVEVARARGIDSSVGVGELGAFAVNPMRDMDTELGTVDDDSNSKFPDCLTWRRP